MARISYDEQTAAAFKAVREVPRDGLWEWREAVRRHLRPSQGMTLVDIGAGTGQFAAAFSDWFDLSVLAVEPSAAMRDQIPRTPAIQVLEGDASALPLPDTSADAAWLSLVLHHIPDLGVAAHEIRRVLRPGAPSSSDRASRADSTRSSSSDGSLRPLGRSIPTRRSRTRARRSRPPDSARTRLSRFVRRGRSASRTSSVRWTPSATPTPRCAASLRTSSSAAKNVSAVPYEIPRTQRTQNPEATGLTCWSCADRFARPLVAGTVGGGACWPAWRSSSWPDHRAGGAPGRWYGHASGRHHDRRRRAGRPQPPVPHATHPLEPEARRAKWEAAQPITVADNVWLGGGVIVCPGVSIGENTVVGAGAVVVKDLPANVVAVGNPARVVRSL